MAGTKAGGLKAAAANKGRHGQDFYKRIGSKGGKSGTTGGFYADRELASRAGKISSKRRRRPAHAETTQEPVEPWSKDTWRRK